MNIEKYLEMPHDELYDIIKELKKKKGALILAHNYQTLDIQSIADFLGDSLELARKSAENDSDLIIFCGVRFMAESAKILAPHKKVILPSGESLCPMAQMVTPHGLEELKNKFPGMPVLCYVNSTASVKALSDICVTSSNALKIAKKLESDSFIFVPDKNLGRYTSELSGKQAVLWDGYCYVHAKFTIEDIEKAREKYPDHKVILHPEAEWEVLKRADLVGSTSQMAAYTEKYDKIILGTEVGMADQLQKKFPEKSIIPLRKDAVCIQMKKNTLARTAWALDNEKEEIDLPKDIMDSARNSLERMLGSSLSFCRFKS